MENSHGDEPVDEDAIAHIERETRRMQPTRPSWDDEMTEVDFVTYPEPTDSHPLPPPVKSRYLDCCGDVVPASHD